MYVRSMSCCGVREISGLRGYCGGPAAMRAFVAYLKQPGGYPAGYKATKPGDGTSSAAYNSSFRYVFFTQAQPQKINNRGYGYAFAAFIRKHKLGEVVIASEGDHVNPNSGNHLKMWTWTVDHDRLNKWYVKDAAAVKRVKAAKKSSNTVSL